MKCPKCSYLGFETGDRCRNCGYDFSLLTAPAADLDLPLRPSEASMGAPIGSIDALDLPVGDLSGRPRLVESALPLFSPEGIGDDEPLIKLPVAPRPPLSVRRTPDAPRARQVPRSGRRGAGAVAKADLEPVLAFPEESTLVEAEPVAPVRPLTPAPPEIGSPGRRATAAAIDQAILLAIDATVVYFTLRLADVAPADWRALPLAPLATFLALLQLAYFTVFTLVGGQTIGKMAVRIRVISDDPAPIDPARAVQRTLAGALSLGTLGLAFLPALLASDRRALHDRLARTLVVEQ
jgi:uncharacterized RDD family membrane protein YckC